MERFKKDGVYAFDTIYSACKYKIDESECWCNNGYMCSHKDCSEQCEDNPEIGKCYSFSCPLVIDGADIETIKEGLGDYTEDDLDNISFNDEGFSEDSEELVIWQGEKE